MFKVKNKEISLSVPACISSFEQEEDASGNVHTTKAKLQVFSIGSTGDRRIFSKEFSKNLAKSLPGTPVVAFYDEAKEDMIGHNKVQYIYGYVPENGVPTFVEKEGKTWVEIDVKLFTERDDNIGFVANQIIGKAQSLELNPETVDYSATFKDGELDSITFTAGDFYGLSVLGDDQQPAFEGSSFFSDNKESFERLKENVYSFVEVITAPVEELEVEKVAKEVVEDAATAEEIPAVENSQESDNEVPAIEEIPTKEEVPVTEAPVIEATTVEEVPAQEDSIPEKKELGAEETPTSSKPEELFSKAEFESLGLKQKIDKMNTKLYNIYGYGYSISDLLEDSVVCLNYGSFSEEIDDLGDLYKIPYMFSEQVVSFGEPKKVFVTYSEVVNNVEESFSKETQTESAALSEAERSELMEYRSSEKKRKLEEFKSDISEDAYKDIVLKLDGFNLAELEQRLFAEGYKFIKEHSNGSGNSILPTASNTNLNKTKSIDDLIRQCQN